MAGYQFAHMQTYSRKGNSNNRSSTDVLLENSRSPGNHPHVSEASKPNLIHGQDPADVIALIDQRIEQAKSKLRGTGKRIQTNTHCLNGAVYSHPIEAAQLKIADEATRKDYLKWRKLACEFAIKDAEKQGMEVVSIVEHMDEKYPHIHVLSIPKLSSDNPRFDAKECHVGHQAGAAAYDQALKQAKAQGLDAKECRKSATNAQTSAFKNAMREWQDDYYQQVGVKCGLARLGPARSRMSRQEWRKTQALSEQLVTLTQGVKLSQQQLAKFDNAIEDINALINENKRLKVDVGRLQNDNDRLVKRNDALSAALSDLEVKHEQDLGVMRENANREIERLENELEQYRPSVSRGLRR